MKKLILVLVLCLCVPALAAAADFTFRDGIKWGMNKETVQKTETAMWVAADDGSVSYNAGSVFEAAARLNYIFTKDDKLAAIEYILSPVQDNEMLMRVYEDARSALSSKYGLPLKSETLLNSMYFVTEWNLEDTVISLKMTGYSSNYRIYITYGAKAQAEALNAESAARQKALVDKFF